MRALLLALLLSSCGSRPKLESVEFPVQVRIIHVNEHDVVLLKTDYGLTSFHQADICKACSQ